METMSMQAQSLYDYLLRKYAAGLITVGISREHPDTVETLKDVLDVKSVKVMASNAAYDWAAQADDDQVGTAFVFRITGGGETSNISYTGKSGTVVAAEVKTGNAIVCIYKGATTAASRWILITDETVEITVENTGATFAWGGTVTIGNVQGHAITLTAPGDPAAAVVGQVTFGQDNVLEAGTPINGSPKTRLRLPVLGIRTTNTSPQAGTDNRGLYMRYYNAQGTVQEMNVANIDEFLDMLGTPLIADQQDLTPEQVAQIWINLGIGSSAGRGVATAIDAQTQSTLLPEVGAVRAYLAGQSYTKAQTDAAIAAEATRAQTAEQQIATAIADEAARAQAAEATKLNESTYQTEKAAMQQRITDLEDEAEALREIVKDLSTIAEGYVRVAGSSSPALSYKSYKYNEQGGFGRESVFSLFYPCLVGTKLTGDDAQVGTILFVLKKLGARLATAEDAAFTVGQAVWEDINGNLHAIDGSEGDVMICNIEPYYSIDGKHVIDGTEYDVFLKSRTPFTWQGIEAVLIDKMGMSPDYCVSHTDTDNVVRMHSVYNPAWNGSYQAPVGVAGKFIYATDPETGDIVETYDAEATLLGGAGGLHSTDINLPDGEQRAMNMNPDTTKTVPFMNQTAEACNRMQAVLLSEGGTFDAHNANLMGSGFSTNDGATAAGDWEQAGSGAKNGMRFVNSQGQTVMRNFGYLTANTAQSLMLNITSLANMINSWRNPWHIMEAYRAVCHAIRNDVHELEWFTFEGNKYKYRSVNGFAGPSQGEATCVVWKMLSTKFTDAAKDPADGTTSLEGNRVDFLVSTALLHGVTTQVSPSWWVSGLIFTEDENGQYECYIERDQHALLKSPSGDYAADQVIPFEEHYKRLATIQKGEGYARNYSNEALMMPDTDANKSGGGLHTYVGKYNWFTGVNAPAGKRSVRCFRRGLNALNTNLSPLAMVGYSSPSDANSSIGFGTCCSLRNG